MKQGRSHNSQHIRTSKRWEERKGEVVVLGLGGSVEGSTGLAANKQVGHNSGEEIKGQAW